MGAGGISVRSRLSDDDRVCIIGGGPAGSFAALHLLELARKQGLKLEVQIFEPRDFSRPGPGGCNRCAGILSSRLLLGLDNLGLKLPQDVIQAELKTYSARLGGEVLQIKQPDPRRRIVSIYRGGGPRLLHGEAPASFDGYLLDQACARGAQHISHRVRRVTGARRPVIHTAYGQTSADLLVLATGINSRSPLSSDFGYRPPRTEVMAQDEILRPPDWPDDQVCAFFQKPPGLTFGALIPKGRYLNISLLGKDFTRDTVEDFIEAQGLNAELLFNSSSSLCGCTPRVAVSPARGYFGHRWVAVGDAAVTRLYKDGIGSAFYTAQTAMQVAVKHGISYNAFRKGYLPFCRRVARDNLYGRLLFRLWNLVLRTHHLMRYWQHTIRLEMATPLEQRIHTRILWGIFTGDEPYRDLFWLSLSLAALRDLIRGMRDSMKGRSM